MRKILVTGAVTMLCVVLAAGLAGAAEKDDEKRGLYGTASAGGAADGSPVRFSGIAGIGAGYDTNPGLDGERENDVFLKTLLSLNAERSLSARTTLIGRYRYQGITYDKATGSSFFSHELRPGLRFAPDRRLSFGVYYAYEYLAYPNTGSADYQGHGVTFETRWAPARSMSTAAAYTFSYRDYRTREKLDGGGEKETALRADTRHTFSDELTVRVRDMKLRVKGEYIINDSNMIYLDYYDYRGPRVSCSVSKPLIKDCLSGTLGGRYSCNRYDSRTIGTGTERQKDNIYTLFTSLFYVVRKDLTLGMHYSYQTLNSNDDAQEYQDSVVTTALYYSF